MKYNSGNKTKKKTKQQQQQQKNNKKKQTKKQVKVTEMINASIISTLHVQCKLYLVYIITIFGAHDFIRVLKAFEVSEFLLFCGMRLCILENKVFSWLKTIICGLILRCIKLIKSDLKFY